MDRLSQIFFSDTFSVPAEYAQITAYSQPLNSTQAQSAVRAVMPGYVLAVLESMCAREIQAHVDVSEKAVVGSSVQCWHRAPIAFGALLRIDGWVIVSDAQKATFWVQASDEQEVVCDGEIRFSFIKRSQIIRKLERKSEVIRRRALFAAA